MSVPRPIEGRTPDARIEYPRLPKSAFAIVTVGNQDCSGREISSRESAPPMRHLDSIITQPPAHRTLVRLRCGALDVRLTSLFPTPHGRAGPLSNTDRRAPEGVMSVVEAGGLPVPNLTHEQARETPMQGTVRRQWPKSLARIVTRQWRFSGLPEGAPGVVRIRRCRLSPGNEPAIKTAPCLRTTSGASWVKLGTGRPHKQG